MSLRYMSAAALSTSLSVHPSSARGTKSGHGLLITSISGAMAIKAIAPEIEVISKPCPLFVPLAEEGWTDNEVANAAADIYLKDIKGVDSLVLGCTHYPILKAAIASVMGKNVRLIDSGEETALEVKRVLS